MLNSETANDLMSTKIISLHPKDKMQRVKEVFEAYNIHHIPIMVGNNIVGIISRSDYQQILGIANNSYQEFIKSKIFETHPIEEYMISEIICCDIDTPLESILDLFLANTIRCIPVVKEGKLEGIITPVDLLKRMKKMIN